MPFPAQQCSVSRPEKGFVPLRAAPDLLLAQNATQWLLAQHFRASQGWFPCLADSTMFGGFQAWLVAGLGDKAASPGTVRQGGCWTAPDSQSSPLAASPGRQ
jgi:hypothetical protein